MGTSGVSAYAHERGVAMSAQSPVRPNIEQLKNQAREFLNALKQGDADAHERLRTSHPQHDATALAWAKEGGADRVAALLSQ